MPQDYNNLTKGLRTQTQIPLDVKTYAASEAALANLGTNDNLAFTYTEGLVVFCIAEKTRWEWREVDPDEDDGLLISDYIYPNNTITFGINYSQRVFNFFQVQVNGEAGPAGTNGLDGTMWRTGIGAPSNSLGVDNDLYLNTATGDVYKRSAGSYTIIANIKGANGTNGTNGSNGTDASNNLQKTITGSYTLTDADNNYTILINNGGTAINITVPAGLISKINIGFIQQGSADVTFVQSSTVINSPASMKKIKGQNYNAYLEQVVATNVYQLVGNLKA